MSWQPFKSKITFDECPFCHAGETMLMRNEKMPHLFMLVHRPDRGVVCPAAFEQYIDIEEIAGKWWNDRSPKKGVE